MDKHGSIDIWHILVSHSNAMVQHIWPARWSLCGSLGQGLALISPPAGPLLQIGLLDLPAKCLINYFAFKLTPVSSEQISMAVLQADTCTQKKKTNPCKKKTVIGKLPAI